MGYITCPSCWQMNDTTATACSRCLAELAQAPDEESRTQASPPEIKAVTAPTSANDQRDSTLEKTTVLAQSRPSRRHTLVSNEELSAYVGERGPHYLRIWEDVRYGYRPRADWNWAGFFFTFGWLAYRKMHRPAFIVGGVTLALTLAREMLTIALGTSRSLECLTSLIALIPAVVVAIMGNQWYLRQAQERVLQARKQELDLNARLALLKHSGGTNLGFALLLVLAYSLSAFVLLFSLQIATALQSVLFGGG